jgi:hypothetical protein
MNKLVMYFDPIEIANHVSEFSAFPECLIFNNIADAADWFKRHDCDYEEDFKLTVFTIRRFGKTLNGKYMWGKSYIN